MEESSQSLPSQPQVIIDESSPPIPISSPPSSKLPKIIGLLMGVLVFLGIGIFLILRYSEKKQTALIEPTATPSPTATTTPVPTATPTEPLEKIKIVEGNICLVTDSRIVKVLIDKDNFPKDAIVRFAEVLISPDKTKMCFLGYSLEQIWLYQADLAGNQVTKIDSAKNCTWSPDSQKIAYNNYTAELSQVDILVYFLDNGVKKNFTEKIKERNFIRLYERPRWSADNLEITAKFTAIIPPQTKVRKSGVSTINLLTDEVNDYQLTEELVD